MKLSISGLNMIKSFEDLRLNAYQDTAGKWTIGYGSTFWPGQIKVKEGDRLKNAGEAETLMAYSLSGTLRAVGTAVSVRLTQNQFDALVSLVYNIGPTNFKGSTLLRLLNAGDYAGAAAEFIKWDKTDCRGTAGCRTLLALQRRRIREREIFLMP